MVCCLDSLFYICSLEWASWSRWGKCSVTCGSGKISRVRKCIKGEILTKSEECSSDSPEQTKTCYVGQCPGKMLLIVKTVQVFR